MNIVQICKAKGLILSVADNGQISSRQSNNTDNSDEKNKSLDNKDSLYSDSHECLGGVCSTNWKPIQHIA